ncbi:MAG: hypothetical protein IID53_07340 [Proteobacteria bacterium]|nr:hypothetical protein [Pseudomonadota bacterium]
MQKRKQLVLDDKYFDFNDSLQAEGYERQSYGVNRGDSIWWARQRCHDDEEIRHFIFGLRQQFRDCLIKQFPGEAVVSAMLDDGEDPNHFFVFVGSFADTQHSPTLQEMALLFCGRLKAELNLDLHPSFFKVEKS